MNGPVFESLLDATIAKLVTFGSSKGEVSPVTVRSHSFRNVLSKVDARPTISAKEVQTILKKMKEIFLSQPMLLELAAPVKLVGDVHGQFSDVMRIFEACGFPEVSPYLFLGPVSYAGHTGDRPIAITWSLQHAMPAEFLASATVAAQ